MIAVKTDAKTKSKVTLAALAAYVEAKSPSHAPKPQKKLSLSSLNDWLYSFYLWLTVAVDRGVPKANLVPISTYMITKLRPLLSSLIQTGGTDCLQEIVRQNMIIRKIIDLVKENVTPFQDDTREALQFIKKVYKADERE